MGVMAYHAWTLHPSCRRLQGSMARQNQPGRMLLFTLTFVTMAVFGGVAQSVVDQGSTLTSLARAWSVRVMDWEQSGDPCGGNWSGVVCDSATNSKVVGLDLSAKGLRGPIPSEIRHLVYLQELYLDNNHIEDPIPAEIGELVHLEKLSINRNNLTSPPPQALLQSKLTYLSLNQNRISGQLPPWIGQIGTLKILDMCSNEFWGALPPEYGQLKNLEIMQLWGNDLSGFIPDEWRNLKNVHSYGMDHLFLTGVVPEWLFELPNLRTATFNRNQFVGPFPNLTRLIHNGIANLATLDLSCNFLQGDYPTQYYNTSPNPNTTIKYYSNCFKNETDGSATLTSAANATQNTPTNCSRVWDCTTFYKQVSITPGNCAPCPSSQKIINFYKCICGKEFSHKTNFPIAAVVGGVVGGVIAIAITLIFTYIYAKKKNAIKYPNFGRKLEGINDPWSIPTNLRRFTLQELEKATKYFSDKNCIGIGGYGKVYRGILNDGKLVAIKCASLHSAQGHAEFRNELSLLGRLHHRNFVALEGFCDEGGLQVLVYEYMENGDLHDNLFGKNSLNSYQRIEVAIDIARALDYLHSFADPPVIHRDIKASNILLDHSMVAKLADFGISKISLDFETHVSTVPIGTMGYLDPDYFRTNQLTTGSDVYAFGIVLLEIITGQPVIDYMRFDALNLQDWVKPRFKRGGIKQIIDPKLENDFDEKMYEDMAEVALRCSNFDKIERPLMKEVLSILEQHCKTPTITQPQPQWSKAHFNDKTLFDKNLDFNPNEVDWIPNSHMPLNQDTGSTSISSGTSSTNITRHFDTFTDLKPR